jgi:autotransporter-associated beta strand protein
MTSSRLLLCSLFAALSLGVLIPSVQAYEQGLPDHYPDPDGLGPGNQRYDYTYWAPTSGSTAWDANNWCWNYFGKFLGDPIYRGQPWYEVTNPTTALNNAMYAVFWDALNSGPPETFKTVDLNSDILVRGLHFRNEGWNIQDADHANTLTLISGSSFPSGSVSYDDRQAITMDTGSQATISANVVLGAFVGSSETSNGINQYIAMGAQSALTISGNISETGAPKILTVGSTLYPPGSGSALTLSGNNTFTGGVTVWGDFTTAPYGRTTTARLNINSAQALGTGPLTIQRGPVILSNTSGAAVTIANSLVLSSTTPGTTGNFYNRLAIVADTDNLVFDSAHDLTVNGDLTLTAHRAIRVEDGAGDLILGGRILSDGSTTSSFFKNGPGTLVLSGTNSTYTGVTQINGGVLEVTHLANAGQASSIGASADTVAKNLAGIYGVHVSTSSTTYNAAADAQLPSLILSNGGTLRYVGLLPGRRNPADLVTTPVSIDASGSGALKFTNAGDVVHVHNMNLFRVLNLTGTNTDDNTFNLALTDITGNTSPFPVVRNQLTKSGVGTWILSGTNTYTGATSVNAGTLRVNGSLANTAVSVASGATLGGSGSIGGLTTISSGARLAPGNSPGTITFTQGLTLNTGSILNFELGTISDLIRVTGGTLTGPGTSGGITLNLSNSGGFVAGTYDLINYTTASGTTGFGTDSFTLGTTIAGYTYSFGTASGILQLTATSAIPEPSTYAALIGVAVLGLAFWRRRVRC